MATQAAIRANFDKTNDLLSLQLIKDTLLKDLLFGKSQSNPRSKKSTKPSDESSADKESQEQPVNNAPVSDSEESEAVTDAANDEMPSSSGRNGRIAHSEYDAVDYYISHAKVRGNLLHLRAACSPVIECLFYII